MYSSSTKSYKKNYKGVKHSKFKDEGLPKEFQNNKIISLVFAFMSVLTLILLLNGFIDMN